jgi:diguanylate cyclase (GGDEF)-like protein/PAS domain S-box-containing protein
MDERGVPGEPSLPLSALRRLYPLIARLHASGPLSETLQAVVDGVIASLAFDVAVVDVVCEDGSFETAAVAGSTQARDQLLGQRYPPDAFDKEFAVAERWGGLLFVPHDRLPSGVEIGWVPSSTVPDDDPHAWHPLDALYAPMYAPTGALVGVLSVDLPHSARRPGPLQRALLEIYAAQAGVAIDGARLAEALNVSEQAFRLAFEAAGVGMTIVDFGADDPGRILRANETMAQITGYPIDELTRMSFLDITHPDDRGPDLEAMARLRRDGDTPVYRAEKRYVRPDGSIVWVALTTSLIRQDAGRVLHGVTQVEDITARRARDEQLRHRAAHDDLTGLANRTTLTDALHRMLQSEPAPETALGRTPSHAPPRQGVLLLCDLDGFKPVNDTHGHDVGDIVLQVVASRLREQVRPQDLVARLGGDEFVVLAAELGEEEAQRLVERLEAAVSAPISVHGTHVTVGVSIGVTALPGESLDPGEAVRVADRAMYAVKSARRRRRSNSPSE